MTLQLEGTINFGTDNILDGYRDIKEWPRNADNNVLECFSLYSCKNFTLTSSATGTFDGAGKRWWGIPGIGYLVKGEHRPRLFTMDYSNGMFRLGFDLGFGVVLINLATTHPAPLTTTALPDHHQIR